MRIKAILTGLLFGIVTTAWSQVNVTADFGNWVEYPLVKKIGVYQTPLVTRASGWLQGGLPKLGQLEPRAFRYEYGWGEDEMYGVSAGITGSESNPTCKFDDWDYLFDNVNTYTSNSAALIFAIGYTPTPLKTDNNYRNLPNNWPGWNETVHQFTQHWKDKGYRNDYVEVWNEPDLSVFSNFNEGDYHNLYINTSRSIRDKDKDIKVGGPAACFTNWFNNLVDVSKNNGLPLDFISGHAYTDAKLDDFVTSMRAALNRNGNRETEMLVTEFSPYDNNKGETHHDGPVEKSEAAASFFHSVRNIIEKTDLTYLTWSQYLDAMDMGSMNDEAPHAITADWGDKMGLIDEGSGHPKALYYAFQLYGMMPADRYHLDLPDGLEGMASRDDNQVDVVLWKTTTGDQTFTLTMKNIPFSSGKLEVYHITPIHNSYYEDKSKTSLQKSGSSKDNVTISNGTYTLSEAILQKGVCFIRIINNDKTASFPKNDFAKLVRTHNWYPQRGDGAPYGQFDAKTWTAYLSTNSGNGWGMVGATAEDLPDFVRVSCKTDLTKYTTTDNGDATLNVRVDYANASGGYDKAVVFHGGVYHAASGDVPQWGTGRAADEAVKVDNFGDFTFDLKKYAPTGFSGRAIITFTLDHVGPNAKADIQVSRGTASTIDDQQGDQPISDTELPTRSAKVYYGFMSKAPETGDADNYSKWDYVRNHADGFYTNFIDMWQIENQQGGAETNCGNLAKAFKNHSCFFEATMEQKVNDDSNGAINEASDRRMIDELKKAGFSVDYASVNYMQTNNEGNCKSHISNLHTYNVKNDRRSVLYLCGPWGFNGNINNSGDAKKMASWTDGLATDGPLGYWYKDQGGMRSCSYSIVKYANQNNMESAIMLCPYSVEQEGYDPNTDFLKVSKDCVFGHEDNGAAPQIWTLWMYGGDEVNNFAQFPESAKDAQGQDAPQCTATGVAFWLLKHLEMLPVLTASGAEKTGNSTYHVSVEAGKSVTVPITLTNGNNTNIELSPVVRAILDTNGQNYDVTFNINGQDVTSQVLHQGGLNFVNGYRLSSGNNVTLNTVITPHADAAATTIQFQVMPNYTNTAAKATLLTLDVNGDAAAKGKATVLWSGDQDAGDWSSEVSVDAGKLSGVKAGDEIVFEGTLTAGGAQIQVNDASYKPLSSEYEDFSNGTYTLKVTADNLSRVMTGLKVKGKNYRLTSITLKSADTGGTTTDPQKENVWKGTFTPANWNVWQTIEGSKFKNLEVGDKIEFIGTPGTKNPYIQINGSDWKALQEGTFTSPLYLVVTSDNIDKIQGNVYVKGEDFTLTEVNIIHTGSTPTSGAEAGFHVSGTQLLDANDNPFVMRGVNYSYAWESQFAESVIPMAKEQGFNTIRLQLSDGGTSGWKVLYAAGLEELIKRCEANKLAVVLNTHDETGKDDENLLLNQAVEYWKSVKDVLNRHKNTVIVNISNEWYGTWGSEKWASGYEKAIKALRDAGIENTLMVDCAGWGQYPQSIFDEGKNVFNADKDKNTVFSIHMYEYAGKDEATVKSNIDKSLALNIPLVIGEFGCTRLEGKKDVAWQAILDYTAEKKVGWIAWSWTGNGGDDQVLDLYKPYNGKWLRTKVSNNIIDGRNGVKATSVQCSVYPMVLNENSDTALVANTVYQNVDVTVKRAVKANSWSTIVLPFALTGEQAKAALGDDVQLAEFSGWNAQYAHSGDAHPNALTVYFKDADAGQGLAANHPYLVRTSKDVSEIKAEKVTYQPTADVSVQAQSRNGGKTATLMGTYAKETIPEKGVFINANKFWYSKGKTTTKGYRAYFDFPDVLQSYEEGGNAKINIGFDEATGINAVHQEDAAPTGIYDLQGRKVSDNATLQHPLPRGIYIRGGKKFVVK